MNAHIYLFIGSILSNLSLIIVFLRSILLHYHPVIDDSLLIPSKRYEFSPEIEGILYIGSLLFLVIASPFLYQFLKYLIFYFRISIKKHVVQFFAYSTLLYVGILFYVTLYPLYIPSKIVYSIFAFVYILIIVLFLGIFPQRPYLCWKVNKFFCWLLASFLFWVDLKLAQVMFFPTLTSARIFTDFLRQNSFIFIQEVRTWQYLAVIVSFVTVPHILRRLGSYSHAVALLFIIGAISIIIPAQNSDFDYFIGPIHDVLGGKTLLVNSYSQYGILSIYLLAFVFTFIPLSYASFFWLMLIITIIGYIFLYLILHRLVKSRIVSFVGIVIAIELTYFAQLANILYLPQVTFIRFGWWIIFLFYLLYKDTLKISEKLQMIFEPILVTLAFYWVFDAGIYIIVAYGATVIFREIIRTSTRIDPIKKIFGYFIRFGLSLFAGFAGLSLFTFIRAHIWPDWFMILGDTLLYSKGFGMIPLPAIGPHIFIIAGYLGMIFFLLYIATIQNRLLNKSQQHRLVILCFITVYGMVQFLYFIGRSHLNNLHHVTLPFIVLTCWVVYSYRKILLLKNPLVFSFSLFLFLIFLFVTTSGTVNMLNVFRVWNIHTPLYKKYEEFPLYQQSIDSINKYVKSKKMKQNLITIISRHDTFFLLHTNSVNIIDSNNLRYFIMNSQIESLARQIDTQKPDIIFIDHNSDIDQVQMLKKHILSTYSFSQQAGVLDVWKMIK